MTAEPCWNMFGLSYSAYLVLHRVALCAMPVDWQERFVAMMEELEATVDTEKFPGSFQVRAKENGKYVSDPFTNYRHATCPMRSDADRDERLAELLKSDLEGAIAGREVGKPDRRTHVQRQADKSRMVPHTAITAVEDMKGPVWAVPKTFAGTFERCDGSGLVGDAGRAGNLRTCHGCGGGGCKPCCTNGCKHPECPNL